MRTACSLFVVTLALGLGSCSRSSALEAGVILNQVGSISVLDSVLDSSSASTPYDLGGVDRYEVTLREGQFLCSDLVSDDFDAYLRVRAPDGTEAAVNDDCERTGTDACLSVEARQSGVYAVEVSSYEPTEGGEYALTSRLASRACDRRPASVLGGALGAAVGRDATVSVRADRAAHPDGLDFALRRWKHRESRILWRDLRADTSLVLSAAAYQFRYVDAGKVCTVTQNCSDGCTIRIPSSSAKCSR